jgi:prenylcysteine alpha-carboxyl methylesterase
VLLFFLSLDRSMWIIGYKGWGALLCKRLADCGFLVFSLDYRNFPQGTISSMEADVASGIAWSIRHCERYGGDCSTITIVGQSAGAHLASLAIVKQSLHESLHHPSGLASAWPVRDLTGFVGISGIYGIDNEDLLKHFERRGLKVSTVRDIMDGGQLARCSPLAIVQKHPELSSKMPRTLLIHGSSDRSAPPNESANFAQALRESGCSLSGVWEQYYAGMSHTDPFIECPMHGGEDALVRDVARFAFKRPRCSKASDFDSSVQHTCDAHALEAGSAHSLQSVHSQQLVPSVCVWIARQVVPF